MLYEQEKLCDVRRKMCRRRKLSRKVIPLHFVASIPVFERFVEKCFIFFIGFVCNRILILLLSMIKNKSGKQNIYSIIFKRFEVSSIILYLLMYQLYRLNKLIKVKEEDRREFQK